MSFLTEIKVENIDHLGIIAGLVDEIGIVEIINQKLGVDTREKISGGKTVKAMILNGLGIVSKPLYLFSQFFQDKAIEKLLGNGIKSEYLNDDKLGRTLDKVYRYGLSDLFLEIALSVTKKFKIGMKFSHLDSTSFHLHGEYKNQELIEKKGEIESEKRPILITKGYSRDHRPDLKQCVLDLIVSNDSEIPIFMKPADGNQSDKGEFGKLLVKFKKQIKLETIMVCDSALYTQENIKIMENIEWITRVPLTIKRARELIQTTLFDSLNEPKKEEEEVSKELRKKGYKWQEVTEKYGGVEQRWLIVESEARKQSDEKKLESRIKKEKEKVIKIIQQLEKENFEKGEEAKYKVKGINKKIKCHQIKIEKVKEIEEKKTKKIKIRIEISVEEKREEIDKKRREAGKFILATNVMEQERIKSAEILKNYKEQQGSERGFRFMKDPLFFADSFFVENPERIEAILWLMSVCLLVYNLGQRELRKKLKRIKKGIKNQVKKSTNKPTLRWILQCFQGIHLVEISGEKQIVNVTEERHLILKYLPPECQKYYH